MSSPIDNNYSAFACIRYFSSFISCIFYGENDFCIYSAIMSRQRQASQCYGWDADQKCGHARGVVPGRGSGVELHVSVLWKSRQLHLGSLQVGLRSQSRHEVRWCESRGCKGLGRGGGGGDNAVVTPEWKSQKRRRRKSMKSFHTDCKWPPPFFSKRTEEEKPATPNARLLLDCEGVRLYGEQLQQRKTNVNLFLLKASA